MDFGFSEQQQDVQNLARQILSEQVTPERLAQFDEYQHDAFDQTLWQTLAQAGLLGVALEERFGGMGFGFTELALLIEEVGRSIAALPMIPCLVSAALPVQRFGSDAQKDRLLAGISSGESLLTAALTEPLNENPTQPLLTTATRDGDGYRVSGQKSAVPFAIYASRILLAAKTDDGVAVLLVDPAQAGVTLSAQRVTHYQPQFQLDLDNVLVAAEDVLAGPEQGEAVMQWVGERTAAALCAHQAGLTDHAMRMTASYTSERKQFEVPVATFQAVAHRSANCFIDVACLRLNTYQAVSRLASELDATTEVQIAKIWAGDAGHRVSYASQHMHGGMGIDRDYPLWRYCLWARHNEIMLGSSAQQLAALGARIAAGEAYCA
jgi:alkylation response protein AidB-like acyl-CoA dehydrogenase